MSVATFVIILPLEDDEVSICPTLTASLAQDTISGKAEVGTTYNEA
jgi:hypothetical protein